MQSTGLAVGVLKTFPCIQHIHGWARSQTISEMWGGLDFCLAIHANFAMGKHNMGRWLWKNDEKWLSWKLNTPLGRERDHPRDNVQLIIWMIYKFWSHWTWCLSCETLCFFFFFSSSPIWRSCKSWEPLHTRAKGHDYVVVMNLDSHPKAVSMSWYAITCFKLTPWRWAQRILWQTHETLLIICHVGSHVKCSSITIPVDC